MSKEQDAYLSSIANIVSEQDAQACYLCVEDGHVHPPELMVCPVCGHDPSSRGGNA